MAAIFPPVHVEPIKPGPQRYGLFNAATSIQDLPVHARTGGVQFEPDTCGVANLYTAECPPSAQDPKDLDDTSPVMTATPFVVYASVVCAPVGRSPEEQARRAVARLQTGEQHKVELALWNGGAVGAAPALTLAGAAPVATTATAFHARIAALEEAFYDAYGYQGTIHLNTRAYGAAAHSQMIREVGTPSSAMSIPALLTTPVGTRWSFGAGYDITGPANVAPAAGSVWAFITGNVTIWRSTEPGVPDVRQTFNRSTNQMVAVAEREYVQSYDCPDVFAIEVPVTGP